MFSEVNDKFITENELKRICITFIRKHHVMNYVIMLVISDLFKFVYLSYHISCCPLLASTVSLISPVYKIN